MRGLALGALVLASAFSFSPSQAHKTRVQRKALVTVRPVAQGVAPELMIWMRLGGARAKHFITQFDVNRDGRFSPMESKQAGDALGPEAIGGVYLALNDTVMTPSKAEVKAQLSEASTIEVAVLLSYDPRPLGPGALTVGARAGRDRQGLHPHVGEVGVLPPLWLRHAGERTQKLGPHPIRAALPWRIEIGRTDPGAAPSTTP